MDRDLKLGDDRHTSRALGVAEHQPLMPIGVSHSQATLSPNQWFVRLCAWALELHQEKGIT